MPMREFDKRLNNDDNFAKLVEYGRLAAKAWWLRNGRINLKDKSFQFSMWYANMKNRYGWADKTENTETAKPFEQMSNDELQQQLTKTLAKGKQKISKLLAIRNVEVEDEESDGSGKVH